MKVAAADKEVKEKSKELETVFSRYNGAGADLIPILQEIQEKEGYLSRPAMAAAAQFLSMPGSVVYGVATFYAQFFFVPQGRHRVKVCRGTACHVRGSGVLLEEVKRQTGAGPGETTKDLKFSVEQVACFGSCALAPVVVVDGKVYGKMTQKRVEDLLKKIQ